MRLQLLAALTFATGALVAGGACSSPASEQTSDSSGSGGAGGHFTFSAASGPPPPDAAGYCGNEFHQLVFHAPNIYFVLDTSGSMATAAGVNTRYESVRSAAVDLVKKLGPLINVGLALFPLDAAADPCGTGGQVMPLAAGDPVGSDGPTTIAFLDATNVVPFGGTPTAATLQAIATPLSFAPGKTIVLLATDGGPNCDAAASCDIAHCISNIEGVCNPTVNCCAPGGVDGPEGCLDTAPTVAAVQNLATRGILVYVVGIPGSAAYTDVLSQMALAGGAPQFAPPYYYDVADLGTLRSVFGSIAAGVVSCDIDLADPPAEQNRTNVWLDQDELVYDATNGWTWVGTSTIELHGKACDKLKSGQVTQVQIVSGCPTQQPR